MTWINIGSKAISVTVSSGECTKEEFRNGMVSTFSQSERLVGWYDPYSPILNVTDIVATVRKNVKSARLTIFGSNLDAIRIQGPYDTRPPTLTTDQIVANWEKGEDWEEQYCSKNNKYYWVIYPCRLDVEYEEEKPKPTPSFWQQIWQLLRELFPFLPEEPPITPPESPTY